MGLTDMGGDVLADAVFGRKLGPIMGRPRSAARGLIRRPVIESGLYLVHQSCHLAVGGRELVYASLDSFSNSPESANLGFNSLSLVNKIPYTKPYAGHKQYREGLEPIIPQPAQYRQQYCNKRDVHLVHFAIP